MEFTVNDIVSKLPANPEEGDSYILDASTADSSHKFQPVVTFNGSKWLPAYPNIGDHARVVNADKDQSYQYKEGGWQSMGNPNLSSK